MNSRIAQLAARLDSLSRAGPASQGGLKICRGSEGYFLPLPVELVQTLSLQAGDPVEIRVGATEAIAVLQRASVDSRSAHPAGGYQGSSPSGSSSGSSCMPE